MEKQILTEEQREYIEAHTDELEELVLRLARIPAPTGKEEQRAKFCLEWLQANGAEDAYIDEVGNVVYAYSSQCSWRDSAADSVPPGYSGCLSYNKESVYERCAGRSGQENEIGLYSPIIVYMAHMDVVFLDEEELPLTERDGRIYCPGVGDNTANLAVLLMTAKYVAQHRPDTGGQTLLFVCDVGEEGLGNLKGVREICRRYYCKAADSGQAIAQKTEGQEHTLPSRIERFYAFDLGYDSYTNRAVGSLRYRIQAKTKGGHSYGDFGNANAIAVLADLIQRLYTVEVPHRGKTTYNVGTISGGTSVNTIAQQAEMLYEIRSDDAEDLAEMRAMFEQILGECREDYSERKDAVAYGVSRESSDQLHCLESEFSGNENALTEMNLSSDKLCADEQKAHMHVNGEISVEIIGERPCESGADEEKRRRLFRQVETVVETVTGQKPEPGPCSTDCNIPLSMGIPSVCVGTCLGAGAHTREEYIEKASLKSGLAIGLALVLGSWKF